VLPRLIDPKWKVHVALVTVMESLVPPVPSVKVTVTSLSAARLWLLLSPDHVEQKLETFICWEKVTMIWSPSSSLPAVPPVLFLRTTLVMFGPVALTWLLFGLLQLALLPE